VVILIIIIITCKFGDNHGTSIPVGCCRGDDEGLDNVVLLVADTPEVLVIEMTVELWLML